MPEIDVFAIRNNRNRCWKAQEYLNFKWQASVKDTAAVYAMSDIAYTAAVYAITATGKR